MPEPAMKIELNVIVDVVCDKPQPVIALVAEARARIAELIEGKSLCNGNARFRNTAVSLINSKADG